MLGNVYGNEAVSCNGLKDAQTFVSTLKILKEWAAVNC
jgi:hypothetical protein